VQLVWSLTPSISNVVIRDVPVETYGALRYSIGGLCFLIAARLKGPLRTPRSDFPIVVLLGVVAYGFSSLGTLYGLQMGGVVNFALASGMNATITAVISILILKEKIGARFPLAVVLSLAGSLALFAGKHSISGSEIAAGSLFLVWTAYVCEAIGFVYSKRFSPRSSLPEYLAILQLSAGAFLWFLAPPTDYAAIPARAWAGVLFVSLVSCVLCVGGIYWLLRHVDGHKLAFFDCFHAIGATVLGAVLFDEAFSALMVFGGILLLTATQQSIALPRPFRRKELSSELVLMEPKRQSHL
jgi:drug/metabolite transporter (DMT)-like permease